MRRLEAIAGDARTLVGWLCPLHGVTLRAPDHDVMEHMKMQYLGVLGLLARCSLGLRGTHEETAEEMRACIEEALEDAKNVVPKLRWKRVLDRIEVEVL